MHSLPLSERLSEYLLSHRIDMAFQKQLKMFVQNPLHPSLRTEILEPKHLRLYSFRVTRQYRAIFIYRSGGTIEIIDVNNHYR